jgi:mono/diheme cytochrome c family protein
MPRFRPAAASTLRSLAVLCGAAWLTAVVIPAASQGVPIVPAAKTTEYRALVDKYCVTCHNARLKTAGLALDAASLDNLQVDAPVWEKVIHKLRLGAMPPQGLPRPDEVTIGAFVRSLETGLDAWSVAHPNPGRAPLHRLNRAEYANAIRDLLDLKIDVSALLPADSASYGFDNVSDTLKISPLLLSRYLNAAEKVSAVAVGDPDVGEEALIFTVPKEESQDQYAEGMPLGTQGGMIVEHNFPLDAEYAFKGELWATYAGGARGLEGHDKPYYFIVSVDGQEMLRTPLGGKQGNDLGYRTAGGAIKDARDRMQVRVRVTAGPHKVGFGFLKTPGGAASTQENLAPAVRASIGVFEPFGAPKLQHVFISGPFDPTGAGDTPSRRRIFKCRPARASDEERCARQILSSVARKAYSRQPGEPEIAELMEFYRQARREGTFEKGIQMALPRVLAGPEFIFRSYPEPPDARAGARYRISDAELASRLALFLWSSIPDDELVNLASANKLRNPAVLERQVKRMIADRRSRAFVENFAGQWLYLRNLQRVSPDNIDFTDWDDNLRQAFARETELFFDSIVREDRSVFELLTADYTFVNERLAKHYGIPDVYGPRFRRVALPDENRRGLLGQGSILTVTSISNRTSPVNRGKWVLAELLNAPPPPPPPGVDTNLQTEGEAGAPKTMRALMEKHRQSQPCAGCHKLMDPIGLALENFDGIGKWRSADAGAPIDATATLFNGDAVNGPAELRKALLKRSDVILETITRKLMTYALARGVEHGDMPAVRTIARDAARDNFRFSSIVLGIVRSEPFQMKIKMSEPPSGVSARNAGPREDRRP